MQECHDNILMKLSAVELRQLQKEMWALQRQEYQSPVQMYDNLLKSIAAVSEYATDKMEYSSWERNAFFDYG